MGFRIVDIAGDGGCFVWATILSRAEGARSRNLLLLHALMVKLPMFFQSFRCALIVVSRRWMMRLYKVWASPSQLGEVVVLLTGVLNDGERWNCVLFAVWTLVSCVTFSIFSKDLSVIWGCIALLI